MDLKDKIKYELINAKAKENIFYCIYQANFVVFLPFSHEYERISNFLLYCVFYVMNIHKKLNVLIIIEDLHVS